MNNSINNNNNNQLFDQQYILQNFTLAIKQGNEQQALEGLMKLLRFDSRYFVESPQIVNCDNNLISNQSAMNFLPADVKELLQKELSYDYHNQYIYNKQQEEADRQQSLFQTQQLEENQKQIQIQAIQKEHKEKDLQNQQKRQEILNKKEAIQSVLIINSQVSSESDEEENEDTFMDQLDVALNNIEINNKKTNTNTTNKNQIQGQKKQQMPNQINDGEQTESFSLKKNNPFPYSIKSREQTESFNPNKIQPLNKPNFNEDETQIFHKDQITRASNINQLPPTFIGKQIPNQQDPLSNKNGQFQNLQSHLNQGTQNNSKLPPTSQFQFIQMGNPQYKRVADIQQKAYPISQQPQTVIKPNMPQNAQNTSPYQIPPTRQQVQEQMKNQQQLPPQFQQSNQNQNFRQLPPFQQSNQNQNYMQTAQPIQNNQQQLNNFQPTFQKNQQQMNNQLPPYQNVQNQFSNQQPNQTNKVNDIIDSSSFSTVSSQQSQQSEQTVGYIQNKWDTNISIDKTVFINLKK